MRRIAPLLILLPFLAAASAPVQPQGPSLDQELRQARSEQAAAEARAAKLDQVASKARNEVEKLRAEQAASAQAMEAAEARITAADTQLRIASAYVAAHRRQLAEQQRPVSSLLAGLAVMGQRPPLMAIADRASADELVRVRILLGSTLPVIRARTARLSAELEEGRKLEHAAVLAQAELAGSRRNLIARRQQFAVLEQRSLDLAARTGAQALTASDAAIAAGENVEGLQGSESSRRASAGLASQLAALNPSPSRPIAPEGQAFALPFPYELPASAAVTEGLAAVNESGVRSRGISLATLRSAPVTAPASGTVRFAGPFRDYDGVLIIDHGHGWMSLIVNVSSNLRPGQKVSLGQPVGRALGPLQVELSQNGRRISPALIAGSSQNLSNTFKGS
jgi:septal ring factor EnvC (AmiA/AmiB activator)